MMSACLLTNSLPFHPLLPQRMSYAPPIATFVTPRLSAASRKQLSKPFLSIQSSSEHTGQSPYIFCSVHFLQRYTSLSPSTSSTFASKKSVGFSQPITATPLRRSLLLTPKASSKDVPYSYRYPPMTKKPQWYWRTLACLPYLMPLHETWMYAETAYNLHPFLEQFEFMTYPFLGVIGKLPPWFLMAYFFIAYLGIVRKKEWPHFFRFHVVTGMLLEIGLQVVGTSSRWMPEGLYWGKLGMHVWTALAFGFLFTVLECIRCALSGMYADVPFVCDAAYIQIPYD